ncbi:hypothetical protein [Microbacterium thalli]|uniref:Uncharacterized protein n=1 Tax=Microbacterium thalli TaxID=3027921 RepID=A0ABT5SM47_9MICO|nr:hypothetical protein [Microbacterium thalli]MDD7963092.1 hypothetical protein [Microbacterium thalli]
MNLTYHDDTKARLRHWRDSDQPLYTAAATQLEAIKLNPTGHGIDGTPFVPRLVTFGVPGRDEEYVITWDGPVGDVVFIANVCSVTEMQQRARLNRG